MGRRRQNTNEIVVISAEISDFTTITSVSRDGLARRLRIKGHGELREPNLLVQIGLRNVWIS